MGFWNVLIREELPTLRSITSTLAMGARFVDMETPKRRQVDDSPIFHDLRIFHHILDVMNEHASFQKKYSHHRIKISKETAVLFLTDLLICRFGRPNSEIDRAESWRGHTSERHLLKARRLCFTSPPRLRRHPSNLLPLHHRLHPAQNPIFRSRACSFCPAPSGNEPSHL